METTPERDNLRHTRIPLPNGCGVIPALGFGTLIPDPSTPKRRPRSRWKQDFVSSIPQNDTEMKKR
jgi:hypothetical protein